MILFPVILLLILLWGVKVSSFNESFLSKQQSTSIKGFFMALVFLSHANSHIDAAPKAFGDSFYLAVVNWFGQLMVVMFLFYSGYGVLKSYMVKEGYGKSFFKNRILKTLVNFDICLIPFALLSLLPGQKYSAYEYVLSLVGWESIGNSNWYICVVLILYVLSLIGMFVSDKVGKGSPIIVFLATGFLSVILVAVLRFTGRESWWYNTVICYPFGMFFPCFENRISKVLKSNLGFIVSLIVSAFLFLFLFSIDSMIAFMISALCFALVIVILSSRVTVGNKVLLWLGNHLFEIYILQRIPMIILSELGFQNKILFVSISFGATVLLAYLCKKILRIIDGKLFI